MKKILNIFAWIIGGSSIIGGILNLPKIPLEAIASLAFGCIIFPPINTLLLKTKYVKPIKIIIGIVFFGALFGQVYFESLPSPEKEMDKIKKSNISILVQLARSYCQKHEKCAPSTDEIFAESTGPFEQYKVEDYTYQSIDGGKDCIIKTQLSTEEKPYFRFCIGENLEYLKYAK